MASFLNTVYEVNYNGQSSKLIIYEQLFYCRVRLEGLLLCDERDVFAVAKLLLVL